MIRCKTLGKTCSFFCCSSNQDIYVGPRKFVLQIWPRIQGCGVEELESRLIYGLEESKLENSTSSSTSKK